MKLMTKRGEARWWRKHRPITVPERHIDRFYNKWDCERQPEIACNGKLKRHTNAGWVCQRKLCNG